MPVNWGSDTAVAPRPRWIGKSKSDLPGFIRRSIANRRAGRLEPGKVRAREPRADPRQDMGVVAIQPDQLLRLEHVDVDQPTVNRREGQGLKAEHLFVRTLGD